MSTDTVISYDEVKKLICSEQGRIIDVRTPEEVGNGKIPGTVNIPGKRKAKIDTDSEIRQTQVITTLIIKQTQVMTTSITALQPECIFCNKQTSVDLADCISEDQRSDKTKSPQRTYKDLLTI
ncbi:thiosulfate:glutathione sulfurtransferase isoform X1 [Ranitomeya variabilis]|uniref:thiosulfate:glutathione sulfurtransferase isoform X1 n=1 Tax=Ranitomeya variabilis TaxID=490064 RepID=UPI0040571362